MTNEVGFGQAQKLDPELTELKKTLELGEEYIGEGVLTQFEEEFCKSCLLQLNRIGDKFDFSDARRVVVEKIERKFEKEGLL